MRVLLVARLAGAFILTLLPPVAASAAAPEGGPSAAAILERAETLARAEHKNILLDFDASWCVNCRLYDHFRDDPQIHALLSRALVFATMDSGEFANDTKHANTPGGPDFEAAIGGRDAGFPFMVILDASGKPIVDSNRPDPISKTGKSNIGYPALPEEVDWFVEMLRRGAPSLSEDDLSAVHTWLTDHSTTRH